MNIFRLLDEGIIQVIDDGMRSLFEKVALLSPEKMLRACPAEESV